MRRLICAFLSMVCMMVLMVFPVHAADAPAVSAAAAVLIDTNSGEVLFEKDSSTAMPCGGMARLMAVYTAAEAASESVTYEPPADVSFASSAGLQQGQKLKVSDLLSAVMAGGYDDCSYALSLSTKNFTDKMNQNAASLGMTTAVFTDSYDSGNEGQAASARDLAALGQAFAKDSTLSSLYGITEFTSQDIGGGSAVSRTLMTYDGLKGGYEASCSSGVTAVVSAERGYTRLTAVVIGAADIDQARQDLAAMLDYGFAGYKSALISRDTVGTKTVDLQDGDTELEYEFYLASDLYALMPAQADESKISTEVIVLDETDPDRIQAYTVISMDGEEIGRITMQKKVTVLNPKSPFEKAIGWFNYGCLGIGVIGILLFIFKYVSQIMKPVH